MITINEQLLTSEQEMTIRTALESMYVAMKDGALWLDRNRIPINKEYVPRIREIMKIIQGKAAS